MEEEIAPSVRNFFQMFPLPQMHAGGSYSSLRKDFVGKRKISHLVKHILHLDAAVVSCHAEASSEPTNLPIAYCQNHFSSKKKQKKQKKKRLPPKRITFWKEKERTGANSGAFHNSPFLSFNFYQFFLREFLFFCFVFVFWNLSKRRGKSKQIQISTANSFIWDDEEDDTRQYLSSSSGKGRKSLQKQNRSTFSLLPLSPFPLSNRISWWSTPQTCLFLLLFFVIIARKKDSKEKEREKEKRREKGRKRKMLLSIDYYCCCCWCYIMGRRA